MTFLSTAVLSGFYFNPWVSAGCYMLLLASELYDLALFRKIANWHTEDRKSAWTFLHLIALGTVLSAGAISVFAFMVAYQEGPGSHLMPLFFLFGAAVFAAMNNHQLMPILALRLAIYIVAFLAIPLRDLILVDPPMTSELWLQFFTVLFILYFVIDCSRIFLNLYRHNLNQYEALLNEHKKTKEAFQAKSQFISTVSHELRTPLTSVKSSLDLVNSGALGKPTDGVRKVLEIAGRNSKILADLIDELLDLQRLDAGEMQFAFENLPLESVVYDTVQANMPYFDNLGVNLRIGTVDRHICVRGDKKRLSQVLSNILSNAAKHSDPGAEVIVTLVRHGDQARLAVEDHGHGIAPGMKERVFDRFTQLDASDTRRIMGTGLGMNISRRIVQSHGGTIDYDSELGVGSTFYVELDLVAPHSNVAPLVRTRQARLA